jgi:hypothetical protein
MRRWHHHGIGAYEGHVCRLWWTCEDRGGANRVVSDASAAR